MKRFLPILFAFGLQAQVTAVTGTAPIVSSGGNTPAISISVNNHNLLGGSAPTVTDCGTGALVVSGSTDNAGQITVGTNADGSARKNCQITFAVAFTHAPAMSFSVSRNGVQISPILISTTIARIRFDNDAGGANISYSAF